MVAFLTRGIGWTPVEGQFPRGSSSPQHGHSIVLWAYFIRSYGSGIKIHIFSRYIYIFLEIIIIIMCRTFERGQVNDGGEWGKGSEYDARI